MAESKKKQIIVIVICAILALNIMWTIMQNKFTPKLDSVKSDIAAVEQRMTKVETNGIPDVADLKAEFAALKAVSDKFSERIEQLLRLSTCRGTEKISITSRITHITYTFFITST